MSAPKTAIPLPLEELAAFCRKWKIAKLEVFGSILRDDFGPESDLDFLYTYEEGTEKSLFDTMAAEDELSLLLGREVDLVSRRGAEGSRNWLRREAIFSKTAVVYPPDEIPDPWPAAGPRHFDPDLNNLLDLILHFEDLTKYSARYSLERPLDVEVARAASLTALARLGAAAGRLTVEFRDEHPEVPWDEMRRWELEMLEMDDLPTQDLLTIIRNQIPPIETQIRALFDSRTPSS